MKAVVGEIGIFTKCDFPGPNCPQCNKQSVLLATTNEYAYWCKKCDIRFTYSGLIYKSSEE